MNAMIELATLWASRPGLDATTEQIAAWYQAKARTHERLAAQVGTQTERVTELGHAAAAYEHARGLLIAAEATRPVPVALTPAGVA